MNPAFPALAAVACLVIGRLAWRMGRSMLPVAAAAWFGALVFARPAVVLVWPGYEHVAAVARVALVGAGVVAVLGLGILAFASRDPRKIATWAGLVLAAFAAWPLSTVAMWPAAVLCYGSIAFFMWRLIQAARLLERRQHGTLHP